MDRLIQHDNIVIIVSCSIITVEHDLQANYQQDYKGESLYIENGNTFSSTHSDVMINGKRTLEVTKNKNGKNTEHYKYDYDTQKTTNLNY